MGPKAAELKISDDELRESIELNQLAKMKERGSDLTIFSPRASFMAHHIGDFNTSATWAAICNELCFRVSQLFPDYFVGAAMLPQSPGVDPQSCIPELEKCSAQGSACEAQRTPMMAICADARCSNEIAHGSAPQGMTSVNVGEVA